VYCSLHEVPVVADNVLILQYSLYMVQHLEHTVVEQARSDKEL
jgi:hypothetical protein